ncbi:VapE domain-containing protein [Parabacteroides sp.]|uniref:VapE domain-containing protein n=1 Tax=Parabacteroides sp. TaxID=1869337 RepID=UPI00257BBA74|nr:VapE domain-containing protein [Parabacteroides sp.]
MKTTNIFQPARFLSLRATQPQAVAWESIVRELTDGTHAEATRLFRQTSSLLAEAERKGDEPQMNLLKERKSRVKQGQPAIIASVSLQGGRTLSHVIGYSGFVMVDIDGIPSGLLAHTLGLVKADPHTFLAHVTISGNGIRVFARVEGEVDGRSFKLAWQTVNEHYARLTGIAIDRQCKNATRMSVLCHDPEALFRPEATPFRIDSRTPTARPEKRKGRKTSARRAASTVRELVEREGISYEAHSHNNYICRCLYWMNRFGVSQAEAEAWAVETFSDYDAESVRSTARSCYALTGEHGTQSLRDFERNARGGKASKRASVEEMERYVNGYMEIRRNLLTQQVEVRLRDSDRWQRMSDTIENSLWCAMQREGIDADLFRLRTLLMSDFVPEFHPLTEYLASLPDWDGTNDPIGELAARIHLAGHDPRQFADCLRRWLVGLLAGALDERVVNQVILVLIGPQGSYKTSFMQNLLPPCLHRYYTTKTNSQRLSKDDLFTITENLLVNFEEIDTMRPAELNQLKAMTTALYIDERLPYGRNKVHLPHVASFCATGNNPLFLSDDTGNRRWLVFEVTGIDSPWKRPIDHDAIYAQAKSLLDNGFRYWFQDGEIEEINRRNRRFETPNPARELILTYYRKPLDDEKAHYITASQIVARFGYGIRLSPAQVGRTLRELGFTNIHTRNGNFWLVAERTINEINASLPEPTEPSV